jgi:hypothetical protein
MKWVRIYLAGILFGAYSLLSPILAQAYPSPNAVNGTTATSQATEAEIVKTDGEVLSGTVEEYRFDDYIRIRTSDGKLYEIEWPDIRKLNGMAIAPPTPLARPRREFWQKSWYLNPFELGFGVTAVPAKMNALMNSYRNLPGYDGDTKVSINALGIYFPVGAQRQTLLGFVLVEDTSDGISQLNNFWDLEQNIFYSISGMYFPFGKIGDGLYVKGNFGVADVYFSGYGGYSETGPGVLAEVGYVFPFGRFVRPLVNINYSLKDIGTSDEYVERGIYQSASFNIGLLW